MKSQQKSIKGVIVPMVTPVSKSGDVDYAGLVELAGWLVSQGVDGLFVAGTTGRFSHFTPQQNRDICAAVAKAVGDKVTIYGGACDSGLHRIVENTKYMQEAGADFAVTTGPFYLSYTPEEIEDILLKAADLSPLPILFYNLPPFVGYGLRADFVVKMANHPNVVGYKDSSNDTAHLLDVVNRTKEKTFNVLIGKEKPFLDGFQAGAAGLVVSFANVYPRLYVDLMAAVNQENWLQVESLQQEAIRILQQYYIDKNNARPFFSTMLEHLQDILRTQGIHVSLI